MKGLDRVILHVGMAKAGSTLIQNALAARHEALLARGVLFPLSILRRGNPLDPERTPGHLDLLHQLAAGEGTPLAQEWAEAGPGARTLLLSIENLFNLVEPGLADPLARLVAGAEVTLVAILRAQHDWLASRYYEAVTTGLVNETRPFDRCASEWLEAGQLDYPERLGALAARLEARRVIALDYGALSAAGRLLPAFLEAVDLPFEIPPPEAGRRVNPSVAFPESMEAHRRLNLLARDLPLDERYRFASAMKAHYRDLAAEGALVARPLRPSRPVRRRLMEAVAEGNRRLAEAHLGEPAGGAAFGPGTAWRDAPETAIDARRVEALVETGLRLILALHDRSPAGAVAPAEAARGGIGPATSARAAPAAPSPTRPDAHVPGIAEASLMATDGRAPFLSERREAAFALRACLRARVLLAYGAAWPLAAMAGREGRLAFAVLDDPWEALALQALLDRAEGPSPVILLSRGMGIAAPRRGTAEPGAPGARTPGAQATGPEASGLRTTGPGTTGPGTVWSEPFFRHPDLVLIAVPDPLPALAATALSITRPLTALVDPGAGRADWTQAEALLGAPRRAGRLAAFTLRPDAADRGRARALLVARIGAA